MVYFSSGLPDREEATADESFSVGSVGTLTLGDRDGDGIDTVGMLVSGFVRLKNTNAAGPHDIEYPWGDTGWMAVAGLSPARSRMR